MSAPTQAEGPVTLGRVGAAVVPGSVIIVSGIALTPETGFGPGDYIRFAAKAMIERYSDHAANERTFLAWVRTAIAIMAFGFVVAKFDLFLRLAGAEAAAKTVPGSHSFIGDLAGVLLFVTGGAMMVLAALRFRQTAKDIDAQDVRRGPGERIDFTMVGLLLLLGGALFVYLIYTLINAA
jgi:putative membrane protein